MRKIRWSLVVVTFVLAFTMRAEAQADRPMYFAFGFGPAVNLEGGGTLFKLEQSFGAHILDHGRHPGLFLGAALGESFRSHLARLQAGFRIGYDINVFENSKVVLLVAPHATLGATLYAWRNPNGSSGAFNMGFAGEIRAVLARGKWTVWGRPVGFDIDIRDGATAYYDFLFGAAINF